MGIVNCADEAFGRVGELGSLVDPAISRHLDPANDSGVYQVHITTSQYFTTEMKLICYLFGEKS